MPLLDECDGSCEIWFVATTKEKDEGEKTHANLNIKCDASVLRPQDDLRANQLRLSRQEE